MKTVEMRAHLCGNQHIYKDRLIKDLLERNRDTLLNGDTDNAICYDGIVDEKAYSNQKFRLMFLLKETNGNTSDGKLPDHYNDWNYVGWIRDNQSVGTEAIYPTFRNIAMWTSEFYNVFERGETDKSKYLVNGTLQITDELRKSLRRIAVINLKKTFGGGSTDWNDLDAYLNQDICDILREEISTAEPTVVLCGGKQVFDFVYRIHRLEKCPPLTVTTATGNTVEYIPAYDYIYVNFYHPACRKSREKMFDYAADAFETLQNIL